jgi:2-polyprenyl-3-methyl-5-hydroxy-6-metoxy-1,4-benzoquinol methylase
MLVEVQRLWPAGFVDVCVCNTCSLGFAWPLIEGDAGFYSVLHERVGYPRERWEFRRARERFIKSTNRVLDIGAGRGDFLASLPAAVEKHAVEASPALCEALTARGIVAHASLDSAAAAGPYDVVSLFHVLQYFADPVDTLIRCRAMLRAGGRVLISLPNAIAGGSIDSLPAPPHPLTRWTRTSLESAVAAAGLKVGGFDWIPRGATSLLWDANAKTRARAAERPDSLAARIDAMRQGRTRTVALTMLATFALPSVLLHARSRLSQSQMFLQAS